MWQMICCSVICLSNALGDFFPSINQQSYRSCYTQNQEMNRYSLKNHYIRIRFDYRMAGLHAMLVPIKHFSQGAICVPTAARDSSMVYSYGCSGMKRSAN